jgi:hypothetical protein
MRTNRLAFVISISLLALACRSNGRDHEVIHSCEQDLIMLKKWIDVPEGTKSATWKVVRFGRGIGPSTTLLLCVMEMDTPFIQSVNLKDRERDEGHPIEAAMVAECFPKNLSNGFFKTGSYLEPKGPHFSASEFEGKIFNGSGYFIKLNESEIFLYLITD